MRTTLLQADEALGNFLKLALASDGFEVELVGNAEALRSAATINLIIADLAALGEDPRRLRELHELAPETPLVALTAEPSLAHRLRCLEEGADECLAKPFAVAELSARCRALVRRHQPALLRVDDLLLHRVTRRVQRAGVAVELTRKEFELLECLMLHAGELVTRAQIASEAWRCQAPLASNKIDVFINALRRKLHGRGSPLIHTVRGQGYKIAPTGHHACASAASISAATACA